MRGVTTMVLQTIQVLVPLATNFTSIGFVFLHAGAIKVGGVALRIDDGDGTVRVLLQGLVLVPVKAVVLQAILILVVLLASNDGTRVRFVFLVFHHVQVARRIVDIHRVLLIHAARGVHVWSAAIDPGRR